MSKINKNKLISVIPITSPLLHTDNTKIKEYSALLKSFSDTDSEQQSIKLNFTDSDLQNKLFDINYKNLPKLKSIKSEIYIHNNEDTYVKYIDQLVKTHFDNLINLNIKKDIPKTYENSGIRAFYKNPDTKLIHGFINKHGEYFELREPIIDKPNYIHIHNFNNTFQIKAKKLTKDEQEKLEKYNTHLTPITNHPLILYSNHNFLSIIKKSNDFKLNYFVQSLNKYDLYKVYKLKPYTTNNHIQKNIIPIPESIPTPISESIPTPIPESIPKPIPKPIPESILVPVSEYIKKPIPEHIPNNINHVKKVRFKIGVLNNNNNNNTRKLGILNTNK